MTPPQPEDGGSVQPFRDGSPARSEPAQPVRSRGLDGADAALLRAARRARREAAANGTPIAVFADGEVVWVDPVDGTPAEPPPDRIPAKAGPAQPGGGGGDGRGLAGADAALLRAARRARRVAAATGTRIARLVDGEIVWVKPEEDGPL